MADASSSQGPDDVASRKTGFRLLRYFTIAGLAIFAAIAAAVGFIERAERGLFHDAQEELAVAFRKLQEQFARQQQEASERDLLGVNELAHVKVTRVLRNVLWERDIAPILAAAQRIDVERCRAAAAPEGCLDAVRSAILALPGYRALDARITETMRETTVFKVKVFDLRGVTIYSSEHAQIGEDKRDNAGWRSAVAGIAASELTHRDRFSAFEGVVENRDLISSYVPVRAPGGERVVGVFEIYSDVTGLLLRIREAGVRLREMNAANLRVIEKTSLDNQREMDATSNRLMVIIGGLLVLLYAALFLVARHAQGIIDQREREREETILREQRLHREKMAALGSMATGMAHEIGNPLAAVSAYAQELSGQGRDDAARVGAAILKEVDRIAAATRGIAAIGAARRAERGPVDINEAARWVCDFAQFDREFEGSRVEFHGDPELPRRELVADDLTEVLMNLLQICVAGDASARVRKPGRIAVRTQRRGSDVVIAIDGDPPGEAAMEAPAWAAGPRTEATRRIVAGMGGRFEWAPAAGMEIVLPEAVAGAPQP